MISSGNVYIIAEAGVNHNGSEDLATQLVEAAVCAGADAIKFQTFRADRLVHVDARTAAYQQANTGETSQHAMLRRLELSQAAHRTLAEQCGRHGIEFLSTPFDEESADDLLALGMRRIKVPSGELTNLPFIRHLARAQVPLIVSTGMAELEEVSEAVSAIREEWSAGDKQLRVVDHLVLLHCTSNYPAPDSTVNMRAMVTLAEKFGVRVGYSDHTVGILASVASVALGAVVVEKHFTLNRDLPGPDHKASVEPGELAQMVQDIRRVEHMLGDGLKSPVASELAVRDVVRRSVVARRAIAPGAVIRAEDLMLLRPGTGIAPRFLTQLIGRTARAAIAAGEMVRWEQISK